MYSYPAASCYSADSLSTSDATAYSMALATGGLTPSDPRIQPFIKQARDEHIALQVKVLVSNGLNEIVARERVEKSVPTDNVYFFGLAVVKYVSSLTGNPHGTTTPSIIDAGETNPITEATPEMNFRTEGNLTANPYFNANTAGSFYATNNAFVRFPAEQLNHQTFLLQRNAYMGNNLAQSWNFQSTTTDKPESRSFGNSHSTGAVAAVLANARSNISKSKTSRFDISLTPSTIQQLAMSEARKSETSRKSDLASSSSFIKETTSPVKDEVLESVSECPSASIAAEQQQLERHLQQWTYRVYSVYQNVPMCMNPKEWRNKLYNFISVNANQAREYFVQACSYNLASKFPLWLLSCRVPSIAEILTPGNESSFSSCDTTGTLDTKILINGAGENISSQFPRSMKSPTAPHPSMETTMSSEYSSNTKNRISCNFGGEQSNDKSSVSMSSGSSDESLAENSANKRDDIASKNISTKPKILQSQTKPQSTLSGNKKTNNKHGKRGNKNWNPNAFNLGSSMLYLQNEGSYVEEQRKRIDRLKRFGLKDKSAKNDVSSMGLSTLISIRAQPCPAGSHEIWEENASNTKCIRGTSQSLEKAYLRLCSAPEIANVRSEEYLVKSFEHCLSKWRREKNYTFIEEQFKSIRQDLTVQGIKNFFTATVYQTNARIALQNNDLGQFNQCQAQLKELHCDKSLPITVQDKEEFLCYRVLYLSLTNMKYDLLRHLGELTDEEKSYDAVKFANNFRKALTENNYHRVFQMKSNGPYLSSNLISIFSNRLRMTYLVLISRSHYTAGLPYLTKELLFNSESDCLHFLLEQNAVWSTANATVLDCRKSCPVFEASTLLQTKKMNALG